MANQQVRLDPDVEPLVAEVAADLGGVSLSRATNEVLRDALAGATGAPGAPSGRAAQRPQGASARASRPNRRPPGPRGAQRGAEAGSRRSPGRGGCAHPVNRRIGDRCAMCGAQV